MFPFSPILLVALVVYRCVWFYMLCLPWRKKRKEKIRNVCPLFLPLFFSFTFFTRVLWIRTVLAVFILNNEGFFRSNVLNNVNLKALLWNISTRRVQIFVVGRPWRSRDTITTSMVIQCMRILQANVRTSVRKWVFRSRSYADTFPCRNLPENNWDDDWELVEKFRHFSFWGFSGRLLQGGRVRRANIFENHFLIIWLACSILIHWMTLASLLRCRATNFIGIPKLMKYQYFNSITILCM